MWKSKRKNSGFTLVEMVIAMMLLSLIALSASIAIRIGLKSYDKAGSFLKKMKSKDLNALLIFEQLKLASNYRWKGRTYPLFEGSSDKIIFMSRKSILNPAKPGFFKIKYEERDGKLWVSEEQIFDPSDVNREIKKDAVPLLENLDSIHFKYFNSRNWSDSWYKRKLPDAIYMEIKWEEEREIKMLIPIVIGKTFKVKQ